MRHVNWAARGVRLGLGLAIALGACGLVSAGDPANLKMGNPSDATELVGDKNNFLMQEAFFTLSYNNAKGTPNWVSWRLAKDDVGDAPRKPFTPDGALPAGYKKVLPSDYTGSGFDRGHMCPHSDRSKSAASSKATFVMTNMVPQSPENNQRAWNQLEVYLRDLVVNEGKTCYIVSGPAGVGGVGRNGPLKKTLGGKVVVPEVTWKVVMVLDEDVSDPGTLDEESSIRLIAVIMPNDKTPGLEWSGFRTTVEEVEDLTGFTFFDKVPAKAIGTLKSEHDEVPIPPPSQVHHGNN